MLVVQCPAAFTTPVFSVGRRGHASSATEIKTGNYADSGSAMQPELFAVALRKLPAAAAATAVALIRTKLARGPHQ